MTIKDLIFMLRMRYWLWRGLKVAAAIQELLEKVQKTLDEATTFQRETIKRIDDLVDKVQVGPCKRGE